MITKVLKYSICLYIIVLGSFTGLCQALSGEVTTVSSVNNSIYEYYKDIAYNIIVASFFIQIVAIIYLVGINSPKARKVVIRLVIGIAFTGLLWTIIL